MKYPFVCDVWRHTDWGPESEGVTGTVWWQSPPQSPVTTTLHSPLSSLQSPPRSAPSTAAQSGQPPSDRAWVGSTFPLLLLSALNILFRENYYSNQSWLWLLMIYTLEDTFLMRTVKVFFIKLKINSNSVWFPVFYDDSPVIILRILILTSALKPRERCKKPEEKYPMN